MYSVMEDKKGNLWFGSIRGGVYKYDGKTFTLYTTNDGLADNIIGCMMEDKNGDIWIGTDEGISRLDTAASHSPAAKINFVTLSGLPLNSKKGVTNYTHQNGLCGDRINYMIQDKTGKIWIATRSGLCCFDGKTFSDFKMKSGMAFTNVRCVKEDRNGKIWIGGQEGLYCYEVSARGEGTLTQLLPNFIGSIFEDKAGNIWLSSTEEKGMALYKYDLKSFTKIVEKSSPGDSQIFEITEDTSGNIWFGKMGGVGRYDGKNFNYFTK